MQEFMVLWIKPMEKEVWQEQKTDVDSRDTLTLHDQEQGTVVSSSKGHKTICLTFLELP